MATTPDIYLNECTLRGKPVWYLSWKVGVKRHRRFFATRAEAEADRKVIRAQLGLVGETWMELPRQTRNEIMSVWYEVQDAGLTMRQVWDEYRSGVRGQKSSSIALGAAITEMIAAKQGANRGENYTKEMGRYLRQFATGREKLPLVAITSQVIEDWFAARREADSTRASSTARLATLFNWAKRRGYVTTNPCDAMERVTVKRGAPAIFNVEQATQAMEWARANEPRLLGWLSLALFAGVRPEEADQVSWDHIDLERGVIRIESAKHSRRRIVHAHPTATRWIAESKRLNAWLPLAQMSRRRFLRRLRDGMGLEEWPQDVLRHSAASYWLASTQDAAAVSLQLGNSVGVLMRHYRELVSREDAARFWAISPMSAGQS
jgi:integrase